MKKSISKAAGQAILNFLKRNEVIEIKPWQEYKHSKIILRNPTNHFHCDTCPLAYMTKAEIEESGIDNLDCGCGDWEG